MFIITPSLTFAFKVKAFKFTVPDSILNIDSLLFPLIVTVPFPDNITSEVILILLSVYVPFNIITSLDLPSEVAISIALAIVATGLFKSPTLLSLPLIDTYIIPVY